jgi:hypothetical protein
LNEGWFDFKIVQQRERNLGTLTRIETEHKPSLSLAACLSRAQNPSKAEEHPTRARLISMQLPA